MSRRFVVLVVIALGFGTARADAPGSAVATASTAAAEQEFDLIRTSASSADDTRTEELARQFLLRFPNDPLVPRVELELGRVELSRAMAEPDETRSLAHVDGAQRWLERSLRHADAPTALRARLYLGVVAWKRNDDARAVELLVPLGGSLVDAEDRRLRETTLFEACESTGRLECALDTLDALRSSCRDEDECAEVDARIAELGRSPDATDAAIDWVASTEPTRPSWPALASRAIRLAESQGDWSTVRAIAARASSANVLLDAEARAIAARAERGSVADPHVIGIIAGLSGADAATAVALVHAIARDAGGPPSDRIEDGSFRFVVRDHHGSPDEAARAVSDLVFVSRVVAIIGPTDGPSAARAAARAQQLGVPFLSLAEVAGSRFVFDATTSPTEASPIEQAELRFGRDLAVIESRPTVAAEGDDSRFFHVGGRIDRQTAERLRRSAARAVYLDARPRELPRLVRTLLPLLRRGARGPHVPIVLSRTGYDELIARGLGRQLEGAIVLDVRDRTSRDVSPEIARRAFERIREARGTTREALAESLSREPRDAAVTADAFVVRQGRLVAMP